MEPGLARVRAHGAERLERGFDIAPVAAMLRTVGGVFGETLGFVVEKVDQALLAILRFLCKQGFWPM